MREASHQRKGLAIKRLQTYFSLLATLLVLLFCSIALLVCHFLCATPWETFLLLVPISIIAFALSLLIGHFLAEPLLLLVKRSRAYHIGDEPPFQPDGRLFEADELSQRFNDLARTAAIQQKDLSLRERRQAAFVSDVAHELRTPLTAIRGNADMLLDRDLPPELHDRFVSTIIAESERLCRLTNDLLTLQRIEDDAAPLELARVNPGALCHEVVDMLRPILDARKANVEIVGDAPDVLGNRDRLKQVVSNLVENASRFIEPEGHITIELFGLQGNSVMAVKDDGCGFGDTDPSLLFDRFYRADASRSRGTGGTGLGLAIVKSIVQAHDGTVEAINLPEGGACFIVAIPSVGGSGS